MEENNTFSYNVHVLFPFFYPHGSVFLLHFFFFFDNFFPFRHLFCILFLIVSLFLLLGKGSFLIDGFKNRFKGFYCHLRDSYVAN